MRVWLVGLAALGAPVARADCPVRTSEAEIAAVCAQIEESWLAMEVEPIQAAEAALREALPCAAGPLTPELAARVHRARGLSRVVTGDLEGAARSFAAARYADPGLGLTDELAPEGTPVRDLFVRPLPYVPDARLPPPTRGSLLTDGLLTLRRPAARPATLQHLDASGRVVGTWMLEPGEPLPADPWDDPRRGARWVVRGVGVAGVVVAGGLYGGALQAAGLHADPTRTDFDRARLDDLRERANRLSTAAALTGALAVGTVGLSYTGWFR